jgi:hypothetical protein
MDWMHILDAGLDRVGLVRKVVLVGPTQDDTEVAATENAVGEIEMNRRQAYKTTMVAANWPAVQEAASRVRDEHGRWPTHYALPKTGASQALVEHLQGSTLREMTGMTGQGGAIFLGYDESEHPVPKLPSWMKVEVVEVTPEPEPVEEPDEVAELLEEASWEANTKPSNAVLARQYVEDMIASGEAVVVENMDIARALADVQLGR